MNLMSKFIQTTQIMGKMTNTYKRPIRESLEMKWIIQCNVGSTSIEICTIWKNQNIHNMVRCGAKRYDRSRTQRICGCGEIFSLTLENDFLYKNVTWSEVKIMTKDPTLRWIKFVILLFYWMRFIVKQYFVKPDGKCRTALRTSLSLMK